MTTYIDYENGLVVMRQNPSVELTADGGPGQVRVGVPEAVVQQTSDGAVRIGYDAANPFAPDIAKDPPWPLENNPWTVNGDLVFTPSADGVHVDDTRTDYPSMEVYQDFPDRSSRTVLIDPAIAGNSTGPMVNLPQHRDVGAGGSAAAILLVCAVATTLLARSTSARVRGIALSVVGSHAVVLVGGLVYGFGILRW